MVVVSGSVVVGDGAFVVKMGRAVGFGTKGSFVITSRDYKRNVKNRFHILFSLKILKSIKPGWYL